MIWSPADWKLTDRLQNRPRGQDVYHVTVIALNRCKILWPDVEVMLHLDTLRYSYHFRGTKRKTVCENEAQVYAPCLWLVKHWKYDRKFDYSYSYGKHTYSNFVYPITKPSSKQCRDKEACWCKVNEQWKIRHTSKPLASTRSHVVGVPDFPNAEPSQEIFQFA